MIEFKKGDRVRTVQTKTCGTVCGPIEQSPIDGGDRLPVLWDFNGEIGKWHPDFLRPADTNPDDDPDEVINVYLVRRRGKQYFDEYGTLVVIKDGFFQHGCIKEIGLLCDCIKCQKSHDKIKKAKKK